MRTFIGCFGVCFVLMNSALAQQPAQLSALPASFDFAGSYTCQGSFGSGTVHRSTFTASVILAGKWLQLTERDLQPATGYVATYLIGYDAQQKELVEFDANNFSAATYSSSSGWTANVLTMTSLVSSDPKAPYAANRFLYTITGPDTFTADWQISKTAAMAWAPGDHLACSRDKTSPSAGA